MLCKFFYYSGADNSNNSSNLDTSMTFGILMRYFSKINREPIEIFKMAAKINYCTCPSLFALKAVQVILKLTVNLESN